MDNQILQPTPALFSRVKILIDDDVQTINRKGWYIVSIQDEGDTLCLYKVDV